MSGYTTLPLTLSVEYQAWCILEMNNMKSVDVFPRLDMKKSTYILTLCVPLFTPAQLLCYNTLEHDVISACHRVLVLNISTNSKLNPILHIFPFEFNDIPNKSGYISL